MFNQGSLVYFKRQVQLAAFHFHMPLNKDYVNSSFEPRKQILRMLLHSLLETLPISVAKEFQIRYYIFEGLNQVALEIQ